MMSPTGCLFLSLLRSENSMDRLKPCPFCGGEAMDFDTLIINLKNRFNHKI